MGESKATQLHDLLYEMLKQINHDEGLIERIFADLARERHQAPG